MSTHKPSIITELGKFKEPFNIEIETKQEDNNKAVQNMIKDIAETIKPSGFDYLGTITTHIYAKENPLAGLYPEAAFKHIFTSLDSVSERMCISAHADLGKVLMSHYTGKKQKWRGVDNK